MAALAEAVPDGRAPGPREQEQLATRLKRQVTSRISELDHLLGALAGQNRDPSSHHPPRG